MNETTATTDDAVRGRDESSAVAAAGPVNHNLSPHIIPEDEDDHDATAIENEPLGGVENDAVVMVRQHHQQQQQHREPTSATGSAEAEAATPARDFEAPVLIENDEEGDRLAPFTMDISPVSSIIADEEEEGQPFAEQADGTRNDQVGDAVQERVELVREVSADAAANNGDETNENSANNSTSNNGAVAVTSQHEEQAPPQRRRVRNANIEQRIRRRRRYRRMRRACISFLCIPIVFTLLMLIMLLILLFVGLPMVLFLVFLMSAYYCCTSDPLPPRVLLRALMDVDMDGNNLGGSFANSGTQTPSRRFTSKQDIQQALLQRMCLGSLTVPRYTEYRTDQQALCVGRNLQAVARNHPGRVHWVYESQPVAPSQGQQQGEQDASEEEVSCLVFSELAKNGEPSTILRRDLLDPFRVEQMEEGAGTQDGGAGPDIQKQPTIADKPSKDLDTSALNATALDITEDDIDMGNEDEDEDLSSFRERGTACDICLIDFEPGEMIAWSTNPNCDHAYHSECITDWLIRQPTCPSCRCEYLPMANEEENPDTAHAEDSTPPRGDEEAPNSTPPERSPEPDATATGVTVPLGNTDD